jgi:hypothetical protein
MPPRNKYPAFRDDLTIDQVRDATSLLFRAARLDDPAEQRALRYQAERIIYPHQTAAATQEGLALVLKAVGQSDT